MEVCTEYISYPFIKYNVNISHVTSRQSTVFEWLFLDAVKHVKNTEFDKLSVFDLFHDYFQIQEPEILIRPILLKLLDLQSIFVEITDNTSLNEITVSEITILPLGKEMHQKGLLPGEHSEETMDFTFDVFKNKLHFENSKFEENPKGLVLAHSEIFFPEKEIIEYLVSLKANSFSDNINDRKKKNKKYKKPDWLKDNTEIHSVKQVKADSKYLIEEKKVQLQDGLVWHIEGIKDAQVEKRSLENFANTCDFSIGNLIPYTKIISPDKDIIQFIELQKLSERIKHDLNRHSVNILNNNFFDINMLEKTSSKGKKQDKKSSDKILILTGCDENRFEKKDDWLIFYVTFKIHDNKIIMLNDKFHLNLEVFPVKVDNFANKLIFPYLPREKEMEIKVAINEIINTTYVDFPEILFSIPDSLEMKETQEEYKNYLLKSKTHEEQLELISKLDSFSREHNQHKIISENDIASILINKTEIQEQVQDFDSAILYIEKKYKNPLLRNQYFKHFLVEIIDELNPDDSLSKIWKFIDFLAKKETGIVQYLDNRNIIFKLYSKKAIAEFVDNIFSKKLSDVSMETVSAKTDFEKQVLKLFKVYNEIEDFEKSNNDKKLKETINSWNVNLNNLEKKYTCKNLFEQYDQQILKIKNQINYSTQKKNGGKNNEP